MYPWILFIHSWLRWLVLGAALYVIARAVRGIKRKSDWDKPDARALFILCRLADVQFTLGLLLYVWLSPIVRSALIDMGAAMRSAPLRFFAVEHITAMVVAIAVLNIGAVRVKKREPTTKRHHTSLKWTLAFLLCICAGIPWPGLDIARPLARTSVPQGVEPVGPSSALFARRCSVCHGATGRGDGAAAAGIHPKPRDLRDAQWQQSVTDEQLRAVILGGGLARGLSASMPSHGDLNAQQVQELVGFIRSLAAAQTP